MHGLPPIHDAKVSVFVHSHKFSTNKNRQSGQTKRGRPISGTTSIYHREVCRAPSHVLCLWRTISSP